MKKNNEAIQKLSNKKRKKKKGKSHNEIFNI